jgi:hypothetical protein
MKHAYAVKFVIIDNILYISAASLVRVSSTSVIIGGMRSSSTSWIKGIFRPTAMPILKNLARIRSTHSASSVYTLKLPLCFPWKKEK